ncbi:MAG: hypothetical protein ACRERR_02695 [Moraxellaceae bacterium]
MPRLLCILPATLCVGLMSACASTSGKDAGSDTDGSGISQYICTNGMTVRSSFSADQSSLRLSLGGHAKTLRWDETLKAYSNGKISATVDERFLRLNQPGSRLNCSLQIPATPTIEPKSPS